MPNGHSERRRIVCHEEHAFGETMNSQSHSIEGGLEEHLLEPSLGRAARTTSNAQPLSRKERRHRDTRREIFAAARQLLLEVDPDELSLRQVARRADFSPASLYTYFSSRDELLAALY